MAAPQEGYPGQGYPHPDPYQQSPVQQQQGFPAATSPPPTAETHEGGRKKKRGYAAQAYDFGAGANSALGGQAQGGGAFQPPQGPAYGGYPQQPETQPGYGAPQYGAQAGAPIPRAPSQGYGAPAPYGGVGYQPPEASYPGPGAPTVGVAGITQGMGQMGVGGSPQIGGIPGQPQPGQPQPQQASARPAVLNQLYPTDLLNQPFNVAELELPPPPIILPPNVSLLLFLIGRPLLTFPVVKCYPFTRCKLSSKICPIDLECGSYYTFSSQEIEAPLCTCHSTLHLPPWCG
jgi:protein transport protein SEC24